MPLIVNKNGTSKALLLDQRRSAREAIEKAIAAILDTLPHRRDFFGDDEGYSEMRDSRMKILALLSDTNNQMMKEMIDIDEQEA